MIIKIQTLMFLLLGLIGWHGFDQFVADAKQSGKIELIATAPIKMLPHISTRDL